MVPRGCRGLSSVGKAPEGRKEKRCFLFLVVIDCSRPLAASRPHVPLGGANKEAPAIPVRRRDSALAPRDACRGPRRLGAEAGDGAARRPHRGRVSRDGGGGGR